MCGILAIVRQNIKDITTTASRIYSPTMETIFSQMLKSSVVRGGSSSGIAMVYPPPKKEWGNNKNSFEDQERGKHGKILVHKEAISSPRYVDSEKYRDIMKRLNYACTTMIGHTRAATTGPASNNRNNHPHIAGNIIGVHNGHINSWVALANKHNIKLNSACDSEIIFQLINKFIEEGSTTQEAVSKTTKELDGSFYACIFVNAKKPNEIVAFRAQAPLCIAYYKNYDFISMASQPRFIKDAIKAAPHFSGKAEIISNKPGEGLILDTNAGPNWIETAERFEF